jgi:regulator of replication initiation timing
MPLASYLEDITERLYEEQNSVREELTALRKRLGDSDVTDREAVGADITAFKRRFTFFLDELEDRSKKIFDDAVSRLRNREVNLVALMNKRDGQLEAAREKRDDAMSKRDRTREVNANLIAERDSLTKECKALRLENSELRRKLADKNDWASETKDIKRR